MATNKLGSKLIQSSTVATPGSGMSKDKSMVGGTESHTVTKAFNQVAKVSKKKVNFES
jgi:hypothetical protein